VAKIDKYLYKRLVSMRFHAKIEVGLKPGHSDPEGEATRQSLEELNYPVKSVGVSKVYEVLLEARNKGEAKKIVDEICKRLLANPVKDNYRFEIEEAK
jgi:phosphoribosylformylglycinamidine synthase